MNCQYPPIHSKGRNAVGCISCKYELLFNIKQIHHFSSLFITVTVYVRKGQFQFSWSKQSWSNFKRVFQHGKQTGVLALFWILFSPIISVLHRNDPYFSLVTFYFFQVVYSLYFIAKHAFEGHLSITMWL